MRGGGRGIKIGTNTHTYTHTHTHTRHLKFNPNLHALTLAPPLLSPFFPPSGLKSRKIALMLALLNIGFVFYYHPFFTYISRSDGSWKYSLSMPMPNVALPSGVKFGDFNEEEIYEKK